MIASVAVVLAVILAVAAMPVIAVLHKVVVEDFEQS